MNFYLNPRTKNPRVFAFKEPKMDKKETVQKPTPEQRIVVLEQKLERVTKLLTENANLLKKLSK